MIVRGSRSGLLLQHCQGLFGSSARRRAPKSVRPRKSRRSDRPIPTCGALWLQIDCAAKCDDTGSVRVAVSAPNARWSRPGSRLRAKLRAGRANDQPAIDANALRRNCNGRDLTLRTGPAHVVMTGYPIFRLRPYSLYWCLMNILYLGEHAAERVVSRSFSVVLRGR